jgi:hypothetical protein
MAIRCALGMQVHVAEHYLHEYHLQHDDQFQVMSAPFSQKTTAVVGSHRGDKQTSAWPGFPLHCLNALM